MRRRKISSMAVGGASAALLTLGATTLLPQRTDARKGSPGAGLTYNQDIRPILAENCFPCHGPDSASRKAGLRLDKFADAVSSGAIVPGDPIASELVRRVLLDDRDDLRMPPAAGHKSLTPEQKTALIRWIDAGAAYEQHWSFLPPKPQTPPTVKNKAWARNPIDTFILAKLEEKGLTPAPEADRRTLARRLALDLTGLPPTPEEVAAFVSDTRPDAYEKLVDMYLARPQWGEQRGRYWLDAARYADTHGIHFDNYREIWAYRDWVIDAFNQNMRFDRFTTEQLAGDLLPNPTLAQRVATGFTRCNITTNEGGAISEEYLVLYARDRTETAAQIWLGSTAGCAVCHDHKFDPITQKDFYALSAFFNNTSQNAMDGNISNTPPTMLVVPRLDRARFAAVQKEEAELLQAADARKVAARPAFDRWLASPPPAAASVASVANQTAHLPLTEGDLDGAIADKAFQKKPGASSAFPDLGDFDGAFTASAWVRLPKGENGGAVLARMDEGNDFRGWDMWAEGNKIATHIIHKWPSDALKMVCREPLSTETWHHVCIAYDGSRKPSGVKIFIDGESKGLDTANDSLRSTIRTTTPLKLGQRSGGSAIEGVGVQDLRLFDRALQPKEAQTLGEGRTAYLVSRGQEKLSPAQKDDLYRWWLTSVDPASGATQKKLAALQQEEAQIRARGTTAYVASEKPAPPEAYVLFRGEYDKRREKVSPATPASLPPLPADLPRNRLGLAKWLLRPENPLTARVTVNRFWQELFGTGLVKTSGDFGITGELPSHPELLDWLALDFRKDWDIKRFFKQLVMSQTYRQSSVLTPEKKAKDLNNRLLSRGPRYRMDGEMLRDYALATSGLLAKKIGGPSVRPYQPDGIWEAVAMPESNTRNYRRDSGESLYRRSMYTFWKRAAPPASMEIFNAPNRETCVVKRERTNTPLQALVTLNDVQFVEAARHLATNALRTGDPLDNLCEKLLSRPPGAVERMILELTAEDLEEHYAKNPKEADALIRFGESKPDPGIGAQKLAAWTMLANQMLNLDEVLNK